MIARYAFIPLYLALIGIAAPALSQETSRPTIANAPPAQNSAMPVATPPQAATSTAANPPITTVPSYPNTAQGLEKLMKDMMKLERQGKQQELAPYAKSLLLPDADNWFKSVFGDAVGAALESASEQTRTGIEFGLSQTLATVRRENLTEARAVRFDDSCNRLANSTEYPLLLLRQRPEPLYDARFSDGSKESVWAYFAYVDGAFRFIGSLKKANARGAFARAKAESSADKSGDTEDSTKERVRVPGVVQQATLIHQEVPVYPPDAKAHGVQGTVVLHAVIAKDGSVRDLDVNEGVCSLAGSALASVKKWRYRPTLLSGEPVEVDTTINVTYNLGNH